MDEEAGRPDDCPMTYSPPYGAPYQPPPYQAPAHKTLYRSRSNRRVAGVAGGLADYLGADATAIRLAFVLVSFFLLAIVLGVVLYVVAWLVIPEEPLSAVPYPGVPQGGAVAYSGAQPEGTGPYPGPVPARPWHDWDRGARSWAIVLGALFLALIWAFGWGPGVHWAALPALLVVVAVATWALARYGPHGHYRPYGSYGPYGAPAPPGPPSAGGSPQGGPSSGEHPSSSGGGLGGYQGADHPSSSGGGTASPAGHPGGPQPDGQGPADVATGAPSSVQPGASAEETAPGGPGLGWASRS
jgi:phage shock protein C